MTPAAARLEVLPRLAPDEFHAVAALAEAATEADGVRPLGEQTTLRLRGGELPGVRHLLLWSAADLVGYLHLELNPADGTATAELVVDPAQRRLGHGRTLLERALTEAGDHRLRVWAHGGHPGAQALATAVGLLEVRSLWQMRRPLHVDLPAPAIPDGVLVRTFAPGVDDAAMLAVNAAAFADHPEQGAMSQADLQARFAEPWFDADGFFLAVRGSGGAERVVGFHWTKVHGVVGAEDALGEIYVLGVDPGEHGNGLGKALSLVGLRHLRGLGLPAAMLYVEADNAPAVGLYRRLGFTHWDTDTMYEAPARG